MPASPMAFQHPPETDFDLLLVGGGLQSGLIALATLAADPAKSVAIIEQQPALGGNHTWCLHPEDAPSMAHPFLEPLLVHRWEGYDVRFQGLTRTLGGKYAAVTSARLADTVSRALAASPASRCLLGRKAVDVTRHTVTLDDGQRLHGQLVVDARGPERERFRGRCGYQKFVGLELELSGAHGLARPVLMDACVPQRAGFRFFYVLPFGRTRLLVEDTTFGRDPVLDVDAARDEVLGYATRFASVQAIVREETGVLPMPWAGASAQVQASSPDAPLRAGYRGGFFHPATGYSFPCALRLACHMASRDPQHAMDDDLAHLRARQARQSRHAERLNWLLFHCFAPKEMWNVFERFYRLPEPLIHRFYAMTLTPADRARILAGKPPRGLSLRALLTAGAPRDRETTP